MKKQLFILSIAGISLSGCCCNNMITDTFNSLQANRDAVDASTCAINENTAAIYDANIKIQENKRQIDLTNQTLKKAAQS